MSEDADLFLLLMSGDALFRENQEDTRLQESYIKLLRGLFKNSGKTDKMIEAAYMTGILPNKKIRYAVRYDRFQRVYYACTPEVGIVCGIH